MTALIPVTLAACRTLFVDSEKRPRRGQFLTISPGNSRTIAQESGKKWAGAVGSQPTITKSDRLLVTGFLGSGKTTLINRILSEGRGEKIAVIENEFGAANIDHALLVREQVEIVEMNNGCQCCTVPGDRIRILKFHAGLDACLA